MPLEKENAHENTPKCMHLYKYKSKSKIICFDIPQNTFIILPRSINIQRRIFLLIYLSFYTCKYKHIKTYKHHQQRILIQTLTLINLIVWICYPFVFYQLLFLLFNLNELFVLLFLFFWIEMLEKIKIRHGQISVRFRPLLYLIGMHY